MLALRRLFQLPSPVDLGWSTDGSLMLREFTPYQEGKSWEDWHEFCRKHYPVRHFLSEELPLLVKRLAIWPVERVANATLDYCLPSRRYHLLDLRGIDPLFPYQHGYLDPSQAFYLAGWGALLRWYREAEPKDPRQWMSPEQLVEEAHFVETYDELMALVHYWTVTRVERDKENMQLSKALQAVKPTAENRELYEAAQERWLRHSRESERIEDEMWLRLAKMRSHLWD
jgi:hypothetical protein